VPTGILRLPWLRVFREFSSVVRQMPGHISQRRGPHSSYLVNCVVLGIVCVDCVVLCIVCKYVLYCTTATGWQPNMYCTVLYYCQRVATQYVLYCTVLLPPGGNPLCTVLYCTTDTGWQPNMYCTVLYYCHRVATQLQLTNISYHYQSDLICNATTCYRAI
jgi:hypothetical protein